MQIFMKELAFVGPTVKHSEGRNFSSHFTCPIYSTKTNPRHRE